MDEADGRTDDIPCMKNWHVVQTNHMEFNEVV